ncbi:unnamed protein product [Effrenium voratum]|nr:unnamed protein product [Effrenium voratum]
MLTLIVWCPPALSVKTLDLLCFFLNGLVALLVSPLGSKANHSWNIRFFCLIVFQVPSSVFVQNRCLGGVCYVFLTALMLSRSFLAEPEEKLDNFLQYPGTLIMVECVLLPCIYTLVINMRSMVRQKVEARLREHEVSSQLDAASALLELTCDAVMELDEDLRLVEHCPKLADMLLRDKGCASLKRARFTDLVARQDSLRAEQNLTYSQHGASNACANAFHTHLVDSCSSKFRTEVFQVKYQMPSGRQCHLIGLRDFTDLKSLAGDKAADAIHDTCPNDEFDAHGTSLEAPLRQRSERSHASASTSEFSYALAESEPSNQGMKYIDKREVEGVGVVEHTVVLKQKKIFLDLDMQTMLVSAASAPVTSLVGRHLAEIFISEYTMELCNRLCRLAQQSPFLPDSVVSFEHMPLFCAPRVIEITGAMQLARSALGDIHVILSFRQSDQPKTLQL